MIDLAIFSALRGLWDTDVVEWIVLALLAVAVFILPSCVAYRMGWNNRDHQVVLEAKDAELQQLSSLLMVSDLNARLAGDYILRRGKTELLVRTIREEVPRVVTRYIRVPGAAPEPIPDCVFTRGYVRVWNQAVQVSAGQAAGAAAGVHAAVPGAGAAQAPAELERAAIEPGDLLDNHIANAEVSSVVRESCEGLQQWVKGLTP